MSFQCPECQRISHHPMDEKERYCVACHKFFRRMTVAVFRKMVEDTCYGQDGRLSSIKLQLAMEKYSKLIPEDEMSGIYGYMVYVPSKDIARKKGMR